MQYGTKSILIALTLGGAALAPAQTINLWRGGADQADWNDPYKWKLQHAPTSDEAVHFRQPTSVIMINSTVQLDNGMMLYGRDLFLEGEGHLNLRSPIAHKRTVNVPASATGKANLTVADTLTVNGRIALAAKAFGTLDSKGSLTLKDRATLSGTLQIGNNGSGTGQVFIRDRATFHISGLKLNTSTARGGSAEIHILGGTAHLETKEDPFAILLEDPSRRIFIGENGTLRIVSDLPTERRKQLTSELISGKRISAAEGCQLTAPVIQDDMVLLKAVFSTQHRTTTPATASVPQAFAQTDQAEPRRNTASAENGDTVAMMKRKVSLESLLQDMRTNSKPEIVAETPVKKTDLKPDPVEPVNDAPAPLAGYIVFVSAALFCIRPKKTEE